MEPVIITPEITEYDTGVHPSVTSMAFNVTFKPSVLSLVFNVTSIPNIPGYRRDAKSFFECDNMKTCRFPELVNLTIVFFDTIPNHLEHDFKLAFPKLEKLTIRGYGFTTLILECPMLEDLMCHVRGMENLELNCPLLKLLDCSRCDLVELNVNCPMLEVLDLSYNKLRKVHFDFPMLTYLNCDGNDNMLDDFHGLEFSSNLMDLVIIEGHEKHVAVLMTHLPNLKVEIEEREDGESDLF